MYMYGRQITTACEKLYIHMDVDMYAPTCTCMLMYTKKGLKYYMERKRARDLHVLHVHKKRGCEAIKITFISDN